MINIKSFGYKRGIPIEADLVLDMRFIPNPYYLPSLKRLTGNNKKVSSYVLRHKVTQDFIKAELEMLDAYSSIHQRGKIPPKYSLWMHWRAT